MATSSPRVVDASTQPVAGQAGNHHPTGTTLKVCQELLGRLEELAVRPRKLAGRVRFVVGVSGAAALGKTRFCEDLKSHLERSGFSATHVELDGFLKDRRARSQERISGYDPRATRFAELLPALDLLLHKGRSVEIPWYDHHHGIGQGTVHCSPAQVVLLDGISALHYEVRRYSSFNIFLDAEDLTMKGLRLVGSPGTELEFAL